DDRVAERRTPACPVPKPYPRCGDGQLLQSPMSGAPASAPRPVMRIKPLLPLVGRSQQLDAALDAITAARDGRGRVVLVHGEAGIGKTRLCHELRSRLDRSTTQLITGRAGP